MDSTREAETAQGELPGGAAEKCAAEKCAASECGDRRCEAGGCWDQAERRRYTTAEVKDQVLTGRDLGGAILTGLDFGGADLRHARMEDADLSDSDLSMVKNLLPEQLAGANLHGACLPDKVAFEAIARVQGLSENAGKLLVSLLAACAFMLLTIARLTDPQILTDSATAKLPVVDAEISVRLFFVCGPVVILGLYFAFHLYLQRLWETLAGMPAIFQDGITLDRKTYPWLVNDLVRLHSRFLKRRCMRSPLMYFQEKLWGFVAYWLPPLLLLPFWARYLCCRDWWVTGVHLAALAVGAWSAVLFSYLARITLERDRRSIHRWQNDWLRHNGKALAAWALAAGAVFTGLSAAAFYGLPPEAEPEDYSPPVTRLLQAVPWALDLCHAPAFARFEDAGLAGGPGAASPLAGARLRNADLRYARAQGAALPGADLRRANLRFADLYDTDLTGANLEGAHLERARLDYTSHKNARNWFLAYYDPGQCLRLGLRPAAEHKARMDARLSSGKADGGKTDLSGYNLSGSSLRLASLRGADLRGACLQYTDLTDADLQTADLTGASLRGADLTGAHLYKAVLDDADVQGAHFEKATVTDETGATNLSLLTSRNWLLAHYSAQQLAALGLPPNHESHMSGGDFKGYQLEYDDLHGSRFQGINFAGANFYQADLSRSSLSGAVLTNAGLKSANLKDANLEYADLTGAQLAGARYDAGTKWPTPDFPAKHPGMILEPEPPAEAPPCCSGRPAAQAPKP